MPANLLGKPSSAALSSVVRKRASRCTASSTSRKVTTKARISFAGSRPMAVATRLLKRVATQMPAISATNDASSTMKPRENPCKAARPSMIMIAQSSQFIAEDHFAWR